jgi:hypothetical protein
MDEILKVLYCVVLANNDKVFTFKTFKDIANNPDQFRTMVRELEKYNQVLSQFVEENDVPGERKTDETKTWVKDIVASLIVERVDASFVMNDLTIADLPLFIKALNNKKRAEMEESRLWTYIWMAPHIDTKKLDRPEKICPFAWETEKIKEKAMQTMETNRAEYEKFMRGEYNNLLKRK